MSDDRFCLVTPEDITKYAIPPIGMVVQRREKDDTWVDDNVAMVLLVVGKEKDGTDKTEQGVLWWAKARRRFARGDAWRLRTYTPEEVAAIHAALRC